MRESPNGWPIALTAWRRVILGVEEWKLSDHSFGIADGEDLVGLMPLQFDPRNRQLGATGWGGCGPILARGVVGDHRAAVLAAMLNETELIARSVHACLFHFSMPPVTEVGIEGADGIEVYLGRGFEDRSGMAQVIDLRACESDLLAASSSTTRQTIRKARATGILVGREDWASCVDEYCGVHQENYRRTGVSPHPRAYFYGIAEHMAPLGYSVLWVARDPEGRAIGFHNDMHFRAGAWYHTGCSTQLGLQKGANYLLFWEALRGAKLSGRRFFDCGEVFPNVDQGKSAGLTFFKTRFGGTAKPFRRVAKKYESAEEGAGKCFGPGSILGGLKHFVKSKIFQLSGM